MARAAERGSHQLTFEFPDGTTATATAADDEYVLAAGRRAGLELPSRCEVGWDLACAVLVLAGDWDDSDARRYYDADREAGYALICRARARTNLRVRTHQARAMRDFRHSRGLPAPRGV